MVLYELGPDISKLNAYHKCHSFMSEIVKVEINISTDFITAVTF
jgi:hypothetical protein